MKPIRYALVIAASLVLPACNDELSPTAPNPVGVVAGSWQGNVSYQPVVFGYYGDPPICPEQPVTVQLQQQGRTVSGTFQAACVTAEFEGMVLGTSRIRGQVTQVVNGQLYTAPLEGALTGSPVSGIEAGTESFSAANGSQRDGLRLRLTR